MASAFRLTMDEPIVEVIEPGALRTMHCADFAEADSINNGCWIEPVTGTLMLRPSFLRKDWYTEAHWRPVTDWAVSEDWWEQIYRGNSGLAGETARFWGSVLSASPAPGTYTIGNTMPSVIGMSGAIGATLFIADSQDTLVPAAQSNFALARDEGFIWHVRFEADELHRFRNLLYLQWGQVGFHLASDGTLTGFHYPSGTGSAPVYLDRHNIGQLGKVHNRDLYFAFLPIPGQGIVVHVATDAFRLDATSSSTNLSTSKGYLFQFPVLFDDDIPYVHNGGNISVFTLPSDILPIGASVRYKFGYHAIRYATGGAYSFVGPVFDWGYLPSDMTLIIPSAPANVPVVGAVRSRDLRGTVSASLRKWDNSGAWAPNLNDSRRARVFLGLSTADARYTPFIFGAQARLLRRTAERQTTSKVMKWSRLEFTLDEYGNVDGLADCEADTAAAFTLFRRADAPWRLEWTADASAPSPTWVTIGGGLARLQPGATYTTVGTRSAPRGRIKGTWKLSGKNARFQELHVFLEAAFDGETFAGVINNVLLAAGQDPIPLGEFPAHLAGSTLPSMQARQNYRFGINPGDSGEEVIQRVLLLARGQWREFRLRYDWAAQRYRIEQKPRDTAAASSYLFTPFEDERGVPFAGIPAGNTRLIGFPEGNLNIFPPEASIVQAVGVSEPGSGGKQIAGFPFRSYEVMTNGSSLNYLGRAVGARLLFEELSDTDSADVMSRRLFDLLRVREENIDVVGVGFDPVLLPCGLGATLFGPPRSLVRAVDAVGSRFTLVDGWLKRVHVAALAGFCGSEEVTYTVSSRWEGGLHD